MPRAAAVLVTLAGLLSGCALTEQGTPPPIVPAILPRPAAPRVEAMPQPEGPPLQCDGVTFESPGDLLAQHQTLRAELDKARSSNEELQARLRVASNRVQALEALETEHRRQIDQLTAERDKSTAAAGRVQAEVTKAQAALATANARVAELEGTAPEIGQLRQRVAELSAQWGDAERRARETKRRVLQAELARVKAEQRLVALQIVMARQQAIHSRRTDAPTAPDATLKK